MKLLIAIQGVAGSNSERAAIALMQTHGIAQYELLYVVTSNGVLEAIKGGHADLGVVGLRNSIAGIVKETADAFAQGGVTVRAEIPIPINHCVFVKDASIKAESIRWIASHEQALRQCEATLRKLFPSAQAKPQADTAICAEKLASGEFGVDAAIVCSKGAGADRGLHLLYDSVQDRADNVTTFALIEAKKPRVEDKFLTDALRRLSYIAMGRQGLALAPRVVVIAAIMAAFGLNSYLSLPWYSAATLLGGPVAIVFSILTSRRIQNFVVNRKIAGYWSYHIRPEGSATPGSLNPKYRRVVCIDEQEGALRIRGWRCDPVSCLMWKSRFVVVTDLKAKEGQITYWYDSLPNAGTGDHFNGITNVEWSSDKPWRAATRLAGWYFGRLTGDVGLIVFERITKEEFEKQVPSGAA